MRLFLLVACALLSVLPATGCSGKTAPVVPANPETLFTVNAPLLNLLKCPSQTCDVLEDLHAGQKVIVVTPDIHGWAEVVDPATGERGFVLARGLSHP